MILLTIANQKGGVGKTTLTTLLALSLKNKYKVTIVDTDPQASLYKNMTTVENNKIEVFKQELTDFVNNIESYTHYDIVIVDTLPSTDINIINLFVASNLIIIPTGVNQLDITACLNTVKILNSINKPYQIIFNNVKNANDFQEVKDFFNKNKIPMTKNHLASRVAYSRLFKNDLNIDDSKATAELNELIKEIL